MKCPVEETPSYEDKVLKTFEDSSGINKLDEFNNKLIELVPKSAVTNYPSAMPQNQPPLPTNMYPQRYTQPAAYPVQQPYPTQRPIYISGQTGYQAPRPAYPGYPQPTTTYQQVYSGALPYPR